MLAVFTTKTTASSGMFQRNVPEPDFLGVSHEMAVQALEEAKDSLLARIWMKILLDECLPLDLAG